MATANTSVLYELGGRMKASRLQCGKSLTDVAVAVGTDKSNISKIERGIRLPDLETIGRIADELETPIGSWFEGSDDSCNITKLNHFIGVNQNRIKKMSPDQIDAMCSIFEQFLQVAGV